MKELITDIKEQEKPSKSKRLIESSVNLSELKVAKMSQSKIWTSIQLKVERIIFMRGKKKTLKKRLKVAYFNYATESGVALRHKFSKS